MSDSISRRRTPSTYDFHFADPDFVTFMMLRHTWFAVDKVTANRLSKAGLTLDKLAVLWASRDYPGALTPTRIARLLFVTKQTVVRLLDGMEKKSLVKTVPKCKGHPFREVKLTPKGEKACARGTETLKVAVARLMSNLSPEEVERLQYLLRLLRDRALDQLDLKAELATGFVRGQAIPFNR